MTFQIEYGISSKPKKDEDCNGDSYFIGEENGFFIGAIADGLGHGIYANDASKLAVDYITNNLLAPLEELIFGCHQALRGSRGVALSIAKIIFAEGNFEFAGVGNVDCKVCSKESYHPITVPGIVGYNLRKVKSFKYQIQEGDLICLYSDGISSKFDLKEFVDLDAQSMAESISNFFARDLDDSTVMILKCLNKD